MIFPLNTSTTKVCKEEFNEETSILKSEPTFDFDIELNSAMNQYDELFKEFADR